MPTSLPAVPLGRTELRVSRLGYGCWRIAGATDTAHVTPDKEAAGRQAVRAAFEAGYTWFDLADIYCQGACERIFGQVLREEPGMRDRITLVTKCGIRFKGDPQADAPYRYDFSAEHIVRSCEGSLKRLGVDRIDLFLLHRPDYLGDPAEVAGAFDRLKTQGKVREFGVSNFRPSQVSALQRACGMPLVAHQIELHLMRLEPFHDGSLDQCLERGMTPLAWSPLAGGRLVDPNPIDLHTADHAHRIHVRELLDQLARDHGVSRTAIALAWLLLHPASIVPIIGSVQPDRIRDAVRALHVSLSREDWYRLTEASLGHRLP